MIGLQYTGEKIHVGLSLWLLNILMGVAVQDINEMGDSKKYDWITANHDENLLFL